MVGVAVVIAEGVSPGASFETASTTASSDSIRTGSQGSRASALRLGASRQGPSTRWQGLGNAKGRADGGRPHGSSSSSNDLDISCLVDNTPFRINGVCLAGLEVLEIRCSPSA